MSHAGVNIRHVDRPRYAEEFTSDERPDMTPWEVVMLVKASALTDEAYKTLYFVRASSPYLAAVLANQTWTTWEKNDLGLQHEAYPDTVDQAGVQRLQEPEWRECWKEAQRYRHRFLGMRENPSVFTFWKPGYGVVDKKPLTRVGDIPPGWKMASGGIIHPGF